MSNAAYTPHAAPRKDKAKPKSVEGHMLLDSRLLQASLQRRGEGEGRRRSQKGADQDSDDTASTNNPYQSYFDTVRFQDFDACGFFQWHGFKSSEEAMATNEWLHRVIPRVEQIHKGHASRLRHVFKVTAANRARYWEELRENEAQKQLRKTVKTSVRDMQGDMIMLMTEEFKRDTQEELADQPVFKALKQTTEWQEEGVDYVALFKEYQRTVTDEVFTSLTNDLIADLTPLSSKADSFPHFINTNKGLRALKAARRGREMTRTVNSEWPAFKEISSRVFTQGVQSYEDIRKNIAKEDQLHPMVMYMQSILLSYFHYFKFDSEVPSSLNEREAFVDCTWSFIRGAFTMANIPTRMLEIAINGNKDRKVQLKVKGERQDCARKADGVGFHAHQQIYIAESALIYGATQDKKDEDAWKSKRALRDSWVSQIKAISQTSHPRSGMSVFGSTSHNGETQFFAMDYKGLFRVRTLTSMMVPMQATSFAPGMQHCILACLEFVLHILDESERRNSAAKVTCQEESEDFLEAAAAIPTTSSTPKKNIFKTQ
ncbi:hypothetical protein BG006_004540 [Podila minutissima]|uniref:Uncharacterized protein n=1 Tax=Podila minutissima TaxID=64525 RepID=A0A9P5VMM8_9FUNG|nr:hypothetical protein BG006_004540 [Podila minutissima]